MAFSYYKSVTIDASQCGASNLTDFPVTIWVTDTDLKVTGSGGFVQNSNGYDIRPYADAGLTSALTFELVTYVSTSGALETSDLPEVSLALLATLSTHAAAIAGRELELAI